jgi:hypothetical protein
LHRVFVVLMQKDLGIFDKAIQATSGLCSPIETKLVQRCDNYISTKRDNEIKAI